MTKKFIFLLSISIFIMIISIILTYSSSIYIYKNFGNPPIVKDWMWEKLPYLKIFWLTEVLIIASIILGFIFAFKNNLFLIPYAIILISIFHILRAGLIILTPLGFECYSGLIPYGRNSIWLFGNYPSGHLSIPYLIFMVSKKKIFLLLTFLIGMIMLISHGHYSIDLIGTLLLVYPLFKFSEKYIRKYFE